MLASIAINAQRLVMSEVVLDLPEQLAAVKSQAEADGLSYAGGVPPALAWELFSSGQALLVDVRTAEERKFVGHVPGSAHVGVSSRRTRRTWSSRPVSSSVSTAASTATDGLG